MSENRVLVLMAGGYPATAVQKHLLEVEGLPLFERVINAVPAKTLWIVHNKFTQGFWTEWFYANKDTTFQDKVISHFVEGDRQGGNIGPAIWMTSGVPSFSMNMEIDEVVFSAIDTYFENFNFMDEFMAQDHAVVVAREKGIIFNTKDVVDLNWHGKLKEWRGKVLPQEDSWVFADMMKTTTKTLLVNGQMQAGSMGSVASTLLRKGTDFKVVKANCDFMDCGTKEGLSKAKDLYGVKAKGMIVA